MTTKITADNIAANTITSVQINTLELSFSGEISAGLPFFINPTSINTDYTLGPNLNAMAAGPITIGTNVTVTVSDGSEWTVV